MEEGSGHQLTYVGAAGGEVSSEIILCHITECQGK